MNAEVFAYSRGGGLESERASTRTKLECTGSQSMSEFVIAESSKLICDNWHGSKWLAMETSTGNNFGSQGRVPGLAVAGGAREL